MLFRSETYASSGSSADDQIDGGSLATDVLNAGSLGVGTFASAVDTPSVSSLVTVSFTATGRIRSGSHIKLVLSGDQEMSNTPVVSLTQVGGLASVASRNSIDSASWTSDSKTLLLVTGGSDPIDDSGSVKLTIADVYSASKVGSGSSIAVTVYDESGTSDRVVDTGSFVTDAISKGSLASGGKIGRAHV